MAALADAQPGRAAPAPAPASATTSRVRQRGFPLWRWAILSIAGLYFLIPLYAALKFAGYKAFPDVVHETGFTAALALSVRLAVITTVLTLLLMVPTTVYVHLSLPRLRRALEVITILPIVIPPVVLIIGVLQIAPAALKGTSNLLALEYVVLAMPFAYRSIDAGLRALDLRTLFEASSSLGANWLTTLWRVVLPNLRTALLSAVVLTVALVLGEYTMASLDLYQTFPVWIVNFEQSSGPVSTAASLLALFVTWLLLMAIVTMASRGARRRGGAEVALFTVGRQGTGDSR
jgi:putative spermidine/putrescine transport system permease protein